MRVISGVAKGRRLFAPKGMETRPITSKIKESLFNIWQTKIKGAFFLDLFAGSGSMGIEALSRGAEKVIFVEKNRSTVEVIKKNLAVCGFHDGYELYRDDVFRRINWLSQRQDKFDIVYLDPPFTKPEIFVPVIESLGNVKILAPEGMAAIRIRKDIAFPETIGNLCRFRQKTYGISVIHFYSYGGAI